MFHNNIVKISEKKITNGTCWKSASKLPTLQISAFIFTMGKSEKIWFFLKTND